MGKPRPFLRELGHRRSARIEAIEISKTAAAAEAAARAAEEAQTPREPRTEPVRRRGRKKQKCRTVEDVVVNSVETGLEEGEDNDNPNQSLFILGSQSNPPFPFPPDKRILEFVLDMLQKHDKERIFAEPVNPLEVEHYYDIIKHPMDLSTMRAKLHEGKYDTLEQFESDVFLMFENAITFNDNNTIYYQEACDLRCLAAKIFRFLRSNPGSCKFEEIFNWNKMSKSVTSGVKIQNEGGSSRFQESDILALPSSGKKCGSSGRKGRRKNAAPVSLSICSDPFAENARAPEIHLGSRGGRKSLIAEKRQNDCRPFASFLSKDEATASIVYNSKPAMLRPVNEVNYIESLRKFSKDLGPKAQEIAERKIQHCELREQQLQAQREIANRIHEQRQAEERQMRVKRSLTQQTSIVPNEPHKFPTASHRPAIENTSHQSMGTQTLHSNLQSRGQVTPGYDFTRLGMSSNQLPPNSSLNISAAQFAPGEFTSALTGSLVTKVGEHCLVMASTRVPPWDLGQSFLPQESNPTSARVPSSYPGPSFLAQGSNLGAAWLPPCDPEPSFVAQQSYPGGAPLPPNDPGPSFVAQQSNRGGAQLPPSDPGPSFVAQQSNLGAAWLPPSDPEQSFVAQQSNLGGAQLAPSNPGPSFVAQQSNLRGARLPLSDPGSSFVAQQNYLGSARLPPSDPGPSFVVQQSNLGGAWLPPSDLEPSFVAQQSNLGDVWLPLSDPGPSFVVQQSNLGDAWLPPSDPGPSFVVQQSNLGDARLPPSDPGPSFVVQQSNLGDARLRPSEPGPSFVVQQSNLGGPPPSYPGPSFVAQQSNLGGIGLPFNDPGSSFVVQQSSLRGARIPPSDPGPSLVAQQSGLAPGSSQTGHSGPVAGSESNPIPQSWLWQAKDPSSSNIVHPMHTLQVETVVDPTEARRLHSESTQNQTGLILSGNQAATWVQQPGFGAGALPGLSQLQEAHLVDLSHVHWSSQMGLNQFQELAHIGSSFSANQLGPWEMQTLMEPEGGQQVTNNNQVPPQTGFNHFHQVDQEGLTCLRLSSCNQTEPSSSRSWDLQGNSGFEGDQPIMTQFPDSALMGPSFTSPAVAWQMQSTGADGDHQFTGHHQLQGSLPTDLCQGLSMIKLDEVNAQSFSETEPAQNWVHHMYPSFSEAQPVQLDIQPGSGSVGDEQSRQFLLNDHIGSSPDGPVDLLTYQHNQQMGSSLAGPVDLLTQLQIQQMGSSSDGPVDFLTYQHNPQMGSSPAGPVDLLTQLQNQQMASSPDGPVDFLTYQHNQQMGSSPAGPVDLLTQQQNQQVGCSPDGPVDFLTYQHNQQMGSSPAGPIDLLTQQQNQQMGSSPAVSGDLLNHSSTMGMFDLALMESCLQSAERGRCPP